MATELTYNSLVNQLAPRSSYPSYSSDIQAKWTTWMLVETLLGRSELWTSGAPTGKWTIDSSCDGSTAGTAGDGVDRWWNSGTFSDSLLSAMSAGTGPFSWFVLKSPVDMPGSGEYSYMIVALDVSHPSTDFYGPSITFSKVQPTGGTTTARPTASDEIPLPNLAENVTWHNNYIVDRNILRDVWTHTIISTRGDFYFYTSFTGCNSMFSSVFHVKVSDSKSADTNKTVSHYFGYDGNNVSTSFASPTGTNQVRVFTAPYDGFSPLGSRLRGRNYPASGSEVVQLAFAEPYFGTSGSISSSLTPGYLANESDSTYNEWYIPVFSTFSVASSRSLTVDFAKKHSELKGRMPDVKMASGVLVECTLRPATPSPTYDYLKLGSMWFPWASSEAPEI